MSVRSWVSETSKGFVGGVLALVITTVGIPVLAWLQSLPWYSIALSAVGAFALTFWCLNQLATFRQRRGRGFATSDDEHIEATLRRWLDRQRYKLSSVHETSGRFQFNAEDNAGRKMVVLRPKNVGEEFIVVGNSWKIPPALVPRLDAMAEDIRDEMLDELKVEMLRLGVHYAGLAHPLRDIGVEVMVACDETCTQSRFLEHFDRAKNAYLLMTVLMRRALRRANIDMSDVP